MRKDALQPCALAWITSPNVIFFISRHKSQFGKAFDDVTAYLIHRACVPMPHSQHSDCQHTGCDHLDLPSGDETWGGQLATLDVHKPE